MGGGRLLALVDSSLRPTSLAMLDGVQHLRIDADNSAASQCHLPLLHGAIAQREGGSMDKELVDHVIDVAQRVVASGSR